MAAEGRRRLRQRPQRSQTPRHASGGEEDHRCEAYSGAICLFEYQSRILVAIETYCAIGLPKNIFRRAGSKFIWILVSNLLSGKNVMSNRFRIVTFLLFIGTVRSITAQPADSDGQNSADRGAP